MAKDSGQIGANGSANVSEETLRSYLLGRLGDEERSAIDRLLLAEDALAERVQLAEAQLIDDYVQAWLCDVPSAGFSKLSGQ